MPQLGHLAQALVEAQLGDAVQLAQAFGAFDVGVGVEAALAFGDHLVSRQAGAARTRRGHDDGPAEPRGVVDGDRAQPGLLRRRRAGRRELAARGAEQGRLCVALGRADDFGKRVLERSGAGERPARPGTFGDPCRAFVETL
jgi:hypothetical protein